METEAEMGGRRPPAQGWTPGAPRSCKRQEGPSPEPLQGAQPGDPLTSDVWFSGLRGGYILFFHSSQLPSLLYFVETS